MDARRNVRLGCLVQVGSGNAPGHTVTLASDALHVRVTPGPLEGVLPSVGAQVGFRLLIDEDEPIQGAAEVSWVNADERDGRGVSGVGLGLKLLPGSRSAHERLAAFLRDFRVTVLAVDRERAALRVLTSTLEAAGYRALSCASAAEAFGLLESSDVSAVIAGEQLEDLSCLDFLLQLDQRLPRAPFARIVALQNELSEKLQDFVALGRIFHFLRKPFRISEIEQAVRQGVDACALSLENERLRTELERVNQQLLRENLYLRRQVQSYRGFEHLVGQSEKLRKTLDELEEMRATDSSVHIHGETGTGKELVARALHFGGQRAQGPFVAQNCAGVPESLLQSTLFGHRKGSFTGADRDHPGVFEQADGGTLFLDEVAELSPAIQAALLRALEGEVTPLGATESFKVNVRIISATHEDLRRQVARGLFREDLFFRLVVLSVRLPPLRERSGDVARLCHHFLTLHCQHVGKELPGIAPAALAALERYPWPGNVRELENEIERLVVLGEEGQPIEEGLLSEHIRRGLSDGRSGGGEVVLVPEALGYDAAIELLERSLIERALAQSEGHLRAAAERLGVERSRLGKMKARLGITTGEA